ncbi:MULTISPECIES: type II secretion system F family protein [Dictyoglomus]|jgi:type IV pilus assembly protein PilC|uniref:General secretion pathway protein F n=1 Tax=Dictyoglomus turgidum (strain DSM 6724 / Z-1310) TaxID=515635 RepID=B8E073_DICTD|nr:MULTISPECIES: type II secretion system F family protein [Dictyoglomus]ACK42156.1 type II secretion system protein [Dictyoglomus turgidum DSM 6724]PNV79001.1 MAG: type II secretion system F family protein [Dictyoglomus turgidum]HBU32386.1 type II secretion system F family protein [Dictyoglomus sp.]
MAKVYVYQARNMKGELITGEYEAENIREVAIRLRGMNLYPVRIEEKRTPSSFFSLTLAPKKEKVGKVKLTDLTVFTRQFATMINAGLSLSTCLNILSEQSESKALRQILKEIQRMVDEGSSLSEAFAKFPNVFSPLYINMVKAAESAGTLDETLERLAVTLEKQQELRRKIKSAMTYPVIVLIIAIGAGFGMLTFLVPIFAGMFESMGAQLPLPTLVLLKMSKFITSNILLILLGTIILILGAIRAWKNPKIKDKIDEILLKIPVFGGLIQKTSVVNFATTLAAQVRTGVPILQALQLAGQTAGNSVFRKAIDLTRQRVREGERIAPVLKETKVFPPMVVHMISIGEESGSLEQMLNKIAEFYEGEVAAAVESLTSLIEPLMMVFVGGIVGGMLIALYLPIFTMFQYIK